ncbi:MAG: acetamidase/formamidase family protein [Candidatus Bathyarchaeia archaeon]
MSRETLHNDIQTNGIIGPHSDMLGPVCDGGKIVFVTAPGCWGPMITPTIRGGHEVNMPVMVEGAERGDSISITIEEIEVLSRAAGSGIDSPREGAYVGDPFVMKMCPSCKEPWPDYTVEGIGEDAVKCSKCGAVASPFKMVNGYTMVFDHEDGLGLTVDEDNAMGIAEDAWEWHSIPANSSQVPILIFGKADIVGVFTRMRPFLGQIGTTPSVDIPDSHNAGDFGHMLIDAPHPYSITEEEYHRDLTDGHLDINSVGKGTTVIAPVKVEGGGVYAGDAHAMQGDGEVAGHTTDVTAKSTVSVEVIKDLNLNSPLILPPEDELPPLARTTTSEEWGRIQDLAREYGMEAEPSAPLQLVGSGPNINDAASKGFQRASELLEMSVEEVKNRVTISGGVEIGRLPGMVTVTLQAPLRVLEAIGLDDLIVEKYELPF